MVVHILMRRNPTLVANLLLVKAIEPAATAVMWETAVPRQRDSAQFGKGPTVHRGHNPKSTHGGAHKSMGGGCGIRGCGRGFALAADETASAARTASVVMNCFMAPSVQTPNAPRPVSGKDGTVSG